MKKIIPIALIFLILFNVLGFYGLFVGIQYKARVDLVQRLDNHEYSEEETFTIKLPLTIPYPIESADFERVDGEIEYGGEVYRMVKQKLQKDTLYVVCIADQKTKRIKQAMSDYVKTFADKPISAKSSGKIVISLGKDYLPTYLNISNDSPGWAHNLVSYIHQSVSFKNRSLSVFSPPPQA